MKFIILLALCGSAALVPVENTEKKTVTSKPICNPTTPCGWNPYKKETKQIIDTVKNEYCDCPQELECEISEDDFAAEAYIKRCQTPNTDPDAETYER